MAEGGPCDGQQLFGSELDDQTLTVGRSEAVRIQLPASESAIGQHHCDLHIRDRTVWLEPRAHQELYIDTGPADLDATRPVVTSEQILPHAGQKYRLVELGGLARMPGRSSEAFAQTRLRVMISPVREPRVRTPQKIRAKRNAWYARREMGAIKTGVVTFVAAVLAMLTVGGIFVPPAFATVLEQFGLIRAGVEKVERHVAEDLALLITTIGRQHGQTVDLLASMPEKLSRAQPDYYGTVVPDIWLTGFVDEGGGFKGIGTAWTLAGSHQGRRTLITNRHVVSILAEGEGEGQPAIRRFDPSLGLVQLYLDVPSMNLAGFVHPQYQDLDALADASGDASVINVADIARIVLRNPEEDVMLGAGLELAGTDTVMELGEANEVGYVGFPFENLEAGAPNVEQPRPMFIAGSIARVSGPMKAVGDIRDRQLLMLDTVSAGGASGSPVFNGSGKVIGVISGGDVAHLDAGIMRGGIERLSDASRSELRLPVGFTYAIRADVVREMVEGAADQGRPERWRLALSDVGKEARQEVERFTGWKAMNCRGAEPQRLMVPDGPVIGIDGVFEYRLPPGTQDQTAQYVTARTLSGGRLGRADLLVGNTERAVASADVTSLRVSGSRLVGRAADTRLIVTGTPGAAIIVDLYTCPPASGTAQ